MNRFEYIVESIDGDYAHLRSFCMSGCSTLLWNKYGTKTLDAIRKNTAMAAIYVTN